MANFKEIEKKWQRKWEEAGVFEAEIDKNKEKYFITVAYPYASGAMHIGHVRTYTLPDVFARFKRMQEYNTLFPMAWHVTGTPIIGALKRLKGGEEKQLYILKNVYNVPENILKNFEKPMDFARYFINESYKKNMKALGYSVDWKREFTTNDRQYNKFIEWQYLNLKKLGLVKKGLHPTKYCINDKNPVTTHDLLEGEDAEQNNYILVKFKKDDLIFPMATLRPETVFGVTHVLINPDNKYKIAKVDGEKWVISKEAEEKLKHQNRDVREIEVKSGKDFIGGYVKNPVTKEEVIILPAYFVDPDAGSGIVMSVPAHAPYDWISLKDLKNNVEKLQNYGIDPQEVASIKPIKIIDTEGYGRNPAKEVCENYGVQSQEDSEKLKKATKELYEREFHKGKLNSKCGEFSNKKVNEIKNIIKKQYNERNIFDSMYDFSEKVICRCGGKVIISYQKSWFLDYKDKAWKDKVHKNIDMLRVVPEEYRESYRHTVDWLESWPCIRNYGLGTRLPFDKKFIIEPLSDSTIYMAFYTVKNIIKDVDAKKLKPEFFDYIFNKKGSLNEVVQSTRIDEKVVQKARDSFKYWYPLDLRASANELVQNHLVFMMYHHTALFPKNYWPKGTALWGMGLIEGEKMSSSKGLVVNADEAIETYGADTVRLFLLNSVEPWQDFDWRKKEVKSYQKKLKNFYDKCEIFYNKGELKKRNIVDRYLESRMNSIIKGSTEALENFQTRKASMRVFFEMDNLISWYMRVNKKPNKSSVNKFIETWLKLMSPFVPHLCEELWERIGKKGFISIEGWPKPDEDLIDQKVELEVGLIKKLKKDVKEIEKIMKGKPQKVKIFIAPEWKYKVYNKVLKGKEIKDLMKDEELKQYGKKVVNYANSLMKKRYELDENILEKEDEKEGLENGKNLLEREIGYKIEIKDAEGSKENKAQQAEPMKPGILLE